MASRLAEQPGPQVQNATVAHPWVVVKGDGAEGGQRVQKPIRDEGQQVVMELKLSGSSREMCGE